MLEPIFFERVSGYIFLPCLFRKQLSPIFDHIRQVNPVPLRMSVIIPVEGGLQPQPELNNNTIFIAAHKIFDVSVHIGSSGCRRQIGILRLCIIVENTFRKLWLQFQCFFVIQDIFAVFAGIYAAEHRYIQSIFYNAKFFFTHFLIS